MDAKPFPTPVFGALLKPLQSLPLPVPGPDATPAERAAAAVAYLERHGSASDYELRDAMGLLKGQHLRALGSAICLGNLHKDGNLWKLGAAPITPTPERREDSRGIDAVEELQPEALSDVEHAEPGIEPGIEPAPAKPPRCRFAVWSDGTVEVKANGMPSLELSRDEFDALAHFVERAA